MIQIFKKHGKEGQERRRRIKESKDVVVCLRSMQTSFYDGKLVPAENFKPSDYPNSLYTNIYGDEYLVLLECNVPKAEFVELFRDKDIFISKKYEDLDGTITQTPFKLYWY